jgi:hypothetical protein
MRVTLAVSLMASIALAVAACDDESALVRQRVQMLERRVDALERRIGSLAETAESMDRLDDDVAALDGRLGALETTFRERAATVRQAEGAESPNAWRRVGRPAAARERRAPSVPARFRQPAGGTDDLATPRGILRWCRAQREAILHGQGGSASE